MRRRLELYRFRYFDELRRRWLQARYDLEAPAIRCKYADYELISPLEIRHVDARVNGSSVRFGRARSVSVPPVWERPPLARSGRG